MNDPLHPSAALLCKLGSIIVHAQEATAPGGHPFDQHALAALTSDPEVKEWMSAMAESALLPVKRRG